MTFQKRLRITERYLWEVRTRGRGAWFGFGVVGVLLIFQGPLNVRLSLNASCRLPLVSIPVAKRLRLLIRKLHKRGHSKIGDAMSTIDDAFERIVGHKASLIKQSLAKKILKCED